MTERKRVIFRIVEERFGTTPIWEDEDVSRIVASIIRYHIETNYKKGIDKVNQSRDNKKVSKDNNFNKEE